MAGEQGDRDGSTDSRRSYSLMEYIQIIDLLLQKGKMRDKIYVPRSVESRASVCIELGLQHKTCDVAYPRMLQLSFKPTTGELQVNNNYDFGMPYEVVDVIPILTQEEKLQMYEALGFPILPPSPHTFGITNGNAAYVVLTKLEKCPLTNKIPKVRRIPPEVLNYKPPGSDRKERGRNEEFIRAARQAGISWKNIR